LGSIPALAVAASPAATTETAMAVSYEQATLKGTVNPEGSVTSYWFEYGKTESYGTKVPVSPESVGSGTSNIAVSQTPTGLSQSTTYHFRVVAENESGTANGEDATFTTAGFSFSFGEEGSGNGQLKQPDLGIATDSEGNIWVADTENNRVEKFNSKGEYLSQFGKEGVGNGEFKSPKGLAFDLSGNIWVVDSGNNRVEKFNSKGEYLGKFGEKGSGEGQFNSPAGIAFSGTVAFIVDSGNNRVQKFSSAFKFLAQFGKEGTGDGEFKSPTGVVVETGGIWVTDTGNNRVERFGASLLNYSRKFGSGGTGEGQFKSPTGIISDFQGRLWVVDSGNDRAEKFNLEGKYQDQFGEEGSGVGQLSNPTGIATPFAQKVLILDTANNRVEGWTVKAEPPSIIARAATGLKAGSAILHANIDPEALATSYWFEYGTSTSYGAKIPVPPESIGSGSSIVQVSQTVTGLSQNTEYHFRAVAESAAGTVAGADKTFKLVPPKATTEAATAIKATQATLNGKVNPQGSVTGYWIEYDTAEYKLGEASHGNKIPVSPASIGSGTVNVAVSQTPTGLSEGTTYHFRVVAESEVNTAQGDDKSFTTLKLPDPTTEAATAIKATQATLNGKVNPLGSATSYWFEYGPTPSYGAKIPISPEPIGSGTENVTVSQTPTGLSQNTEYHFRVVAESAAGTVPDTDKTFTTLKVVDPTTEAATAIKATQATLNGKVNPLGSATSYWFEYGPTTSYGAKIPISPEPIGSGTENVTVSQTPTGLSSGTTYHFRVVAESEVGVSKGTDKLFTTGPIFSFAFGAYGTGNGQFSEPASVATDSKGNVWVADTWNNRIQKFNSKGEYLLKFGSEGSEKGQLLYPYGIATDLEGNVWVADTGNNRVQEFNSKGEYVAEFGSEGTEAGQLLYPYGIATDLEGNVWVADTGNNRVQEFNSKGEYVAEFGSEGTEAGQLLYPQGIATDLEGNVWVADTGNSRVQEFGKAGEYLVQIGSEGSGNGQFYYPYGIAVGPEGNVWVADTENYRVQAFNSKGGYLFKFGSEGSGKGQFLYPEGIATDSSGNVWVVDTGNNRVQKWIP
jgi:sugar lactone lactonase YvrE